MKKKFKIGLAPWRVEKNKKLGDVGGKCVGESYPV